MLLAHTSTCKEGLHLIAPVETTFFIQENKNLFNNLNSLDSQWMIPQKYEPYYANMEKGVGAGVVSA